MGYITFTSLEDAEKAVKDLNGGQFGADAKRKIRVELANDKVRFFLLFPWLGLFSFLLLAPNSLLGLFTFPFRCTTNARLN